jgi:hypothetical protein
VRHCWSLLEADLSVRHGAHSPCRRL